MERKGFGPRLGAMLIDVAIMLLFFCVVGWITGAGMYMASTGPNGTVVVSTGARVGAIIAALFALAYGSTEIFMAGTPGKLILKMKIGSETGVVPAPQDQLVRRYLIKWSPQLLNLLFAITFFRPISWLSNLAGLVLFVGCFFALGVNRQAFHDILAHTAVYGVGASMQQGFQPIMGGGYGGPPGAGYVPPPPGTGPVPPVPPPGGPGVPPPPPPSV
jgi:uncharacterized RDD family membrane protein YckC